MTPESTYLLTLGQQIAEVYRTHTQPVAAMVTGSVADGVSDRYSDLDMTLYYDKLPTEAAVEAAHAQLQPVNLRLLGERSEGNFLTFFDFRSVPVQIGHITVAAAEAELATVLEVREVATPLHKALEGTLKCVPLYGEAQIAAWQARITHFPDALAEAMVRHYLNFFPVWYVKEQFIRRDAQLWWYQILVESQQNLLGVLAGLNHVYYTTFQFKRTPAFIEKMILKPDALAARLDALFQQEPAFAIDGLEQLVHETMTLVERHLPAVDTRGIRARLGQRYQGWTMEEA